MSVAEQPCCDTENDFCAFRGFECCRDDCIHFKERDLEEAIAHSAFMGEQP